MKILEKMKLLYTPRRVDREYIISRLEECVYNPAHSTLTIEITARKEVVAALRKELVSKGYLILAESSE